jgi:transcription antitermination factor NusG
MALRMPRDGTSQPEILTRWACIRTKPQAEEWCANNLYRVGFEVFLPLTAVRRRARRTGHYLMEQVPLFTSYMFLAHEPGSPWRGIRGAPGVGKLLLDGYQPQYVRVGVIELLQSTEDARRNPVPEPVWKPGAACTITAGPFRDHEGAVVEVRGVTARVGLFIFGELRDVSVPIASLLPRG